MDRDILGQNIFCFTWGLPRYEEEISTNMAFSIRPRYIQSVQVGVKDNVAKMVFKCCLSISS